MAEQKFRKEIVVGLRSLSSEELTTRKDELKEELFWLRFKKQSGQLDKPTQLKRAKKMFARLMTIQKEKGAQK